MRCSQCGLPLSPTRSSSSCPRCGTPISSNTVDQARLEGAAFTTNTFASGNPATDQTTPIHPYTNINQGNPTVPAAAANLYIPPTPNWNDASRSQSPGSQQTPQVPFPSPENWQNIPPTQPGQQANMQEATWTPGPSSPPTSYSPNTMPNRPGQPPARKPYPSTQGRSKTTSIGFTIAGLCIIAGGLLLIFVYFIGQGFLPTSGTATTPGITQQSTRTVTNQKSTPTTLLTPTIPAVTPTPTLQGQGLLDTSMLSSNFNEQTGQIIQQSTTFQINQKIYVVLSLHPGGNIHTVCLNWYLNGQSANVFSFQVDPTSNYNYYSYTTMPTAGNGRVDISLASATNCTEAIPAQKLSFTVS